MGQEHTPTSEQFGAYQAMANYFNDRLFGGTLPPVILNFSRRAGAGGFFAPRRWENADGTITHEISLNPKYLKQNSPMWTASILVHELAHLWQQEFGKPSRSGYHNREWGAKMDEVGLMPTDTGKPGGRRTGQQMSHYIVPGGPFERAFREMPEGYPLPWRCGEPNQARKPTSSKDKVKYSCGGCRINVWGKPNIRLLCDDCRLPLAAAA